MRVGVIINPKAGARDALRLRHHIEGLGAHSSATLVVRVHDRHSRIESLAQALAPDVDMLAILGGDGSLNGVVNGIMTSSRPDVPLLFLPAGRGKDAARTLPSWDVKQLDRCLVDHRLVKIDVGTIHTPGNEPRYFINETSIGIGAFAAKSASTLPRQLGTSSYLIGTMHGLIQERPFNAHLDIDGVGVVELNRCHHITIANGRYFGGGLQIAPQADVGDGLLDIVAVADTGALEIARALPRLFRATHLTHPAVRFWQSARVSIQTDGPSLIESDGEQWATTPAQFSVLNHALTWVEPQ